jgi:hypothetical protein
LSRAAPSCTLASSSLVVVIGHRHRHRRWSSSLTMLHNQWTLRSPDVSHNQWTLRSPDAWMDLSTDSDDDVASGFQLGQSALPLTKHVKPVVIQIVAKPSSSLWRLADIQRHLTTLVEQHPVTVNARERAYGIATDALEKWGTYGVIEEFGLETFACACLMQAIHFQAKIGDLGTFNAYVADPVVRQQCHTLDRSEPFTCRVNACRMKLQLGPLVRSAVYTL